MNYRSRLHNKRRRYEIEKLMGQSLDTYLRRQYNDLQQSFKEISEGLAKEGITITPRSLERIAKKIGIESRSNKKAFNLAIKKGRMSYEHQRKVSKYRRVNTDDKLRYKILKRDGFKCVLCGNTAKNGAILEVGHIIGVEDNGSSREDNLQVECWDCNHGK